MSNLVHNEQFKLLANLFNNLAVVSVATGFIAPIFAVHPSATPIGFSAGGKPIFGAMGLNTLASIILGLVFCTLFEFAALGFLTKLKE